MPSAVARPASSALQIAAATIGNALEWFDILIYGYFAQTIAGVFFPNSNPVVSLLLTYVRLDCLMSRGRWAPSCWEPMRTSAAARRR